VLLDLVDVFVCQLQEPAGGPGVVDLTGQPSALLDLRAFKPGHARKTQRRLALKRSLAALNLDPEKD
jgi:hypothetical protein